MHIYGLQKLTLLDYPEHLAALCFLGGCNFRCPFCQNGVLVLSPESEPHLKPEELLSFLKKRRGILDGICISGGEPTLHADLPELIRSVKELGYLVKLDTNGTNPDMLSFLLDEGLLDYIAMDIKSSPTGYPLAVGCPSLPMDRIQSSIDLLMQRSPDYEFRTTAVKGIHTCSDFAEIGRWIAGCKRYFIQSYRESPAAVGELLGKDMTAFGSFSPEECREFLEIVQKTIPHACLRGLS